jgi:Fe-Mn family superoxide dismutase
MAFQLPTLPYPADSLAPVISAETIDYHYGKHHQAYVNNLNALIADTAQADASLEEIILSSEGGLFNNAAQVWNHTFYWHCMTPGGAALEEGQLSEAINASFGSMQKFKEQFISAAAGNFGAGWTWLIAGDNGILEIVNTSNADTPLAHGAQPLLTCDVWEHAYYIDHRNARGAYLQGWWELINWPFVASQL